MYEDILQKITSFTSIKDALTYFVLLEKASKVTPEILKFFKDKINQLWALKNTGFVMSASQAEEINKLAGTKLFHIKETLNDHWSTELILLGLYVDKLNKEDRRKEIDGIKERVHKKYGVNGIRVINLATTGAIIPIFWYLSDLKQRKNYCATDLAIEFDKILENWKKISIFVEKDIPKTELESKIRGYMIEQKPIFFVFSYAQVASKIAFSVLVKLNNDDAFSKGGYIFFHRPPEMEGGLEKHMWGIESINLI